MNSTIGKLVNSCLKIDEEQYPEKVRPLAERRSKWAKKFIGEFGVDHVTITAHKNFTCPSFSVVIDTFNPTRYKEGNIVIVLGANPLEISAERKDPNSKRKETFDFKTWKWLGE